MQYPSPNMPLPTSGDLDRLDGNPLSTIVETLGTEIIGRDILLFSRLGSTNDLAIDLAKQQVLEGVVILAEEQRTGRGRLNRHWQAPRGSSLLMSIVFYPPLKPHQMHQIAMICSLAVHSAIQSLKGPAPELKWPNDVVIDGKKVAGILCEASIADQCVSYVVAGIGLNVNLSPQSLGNTLTPATSLSHEVGHKLDRVAVLSTIIRELDSLYLRLRQGWSPRDQWAKHLGTIGKQVTFYTGKEKLSGTAEDVSEEGKLILRTPTGQIHTLSVGDATTHLNPS